MATGFELRDYRASDFEEIVALDRECFEPGIAYPAGEMRRLVSLVTREAVVAVSEETMAGFCLGYRAPARVGRIITLDVRATHRRGGVGRALLEETIRRLAAAGSRETVLEVDLRNTPALTFYERLGFRRRRTIPGYYGPGIPGVEMFRESPGVKS
ncbi:MAG: GNAT family N-acetyltransferase [Acidobacteriota bacterium]